MNGKLAVIVAYVLHCLYGSNYRYSETSIIRHSMGLKLDVRLQRLSDYPVLHSTVKHGECISEQGRIRENVGL